MAWTEDLVLMTRVLINDLTTPYKNSDANLQRTIVCASIIVSQEVELDYSYVFNISGPTISPDPVEVSDWIFMALVPLKTAAIMNAGQYMTAISQGIKVRDGDSQIDTTGSFAGYKDILLLGPAKSYEKLSWQISASRSYKAAGAVLGPYRSEEDVVQNVWAFYDRFTQPPMTQEARADRYTPTGG